MKKTLFAVLLMLAVPTVSIAQTPFSLKMVATGYLDNPNDLEDRYTKLEVTGPIGATCWVDYTTNLNKTNSWSKTIPVFIEQNPTTVLIWEPWKKLDNGQWINLDSTRFFRLNTYSPK